MKQTIKILCALLIAASLVGCSAKKEEATTTTEKKKVTIGAIQYVEHVALDQATQGFKDGLKDNGYVEGDNLTIDFQNAQGDASNCETIANKFANAKVDLIFANATPAAQAVAQKTKDIPIIITSVTDPESSGLVKSNKLPETNVSGTSDLTPIKEQLDLLVQLVPNAKTIAVMYCGAEENSIIQADIAKKYIETLGLKYVEATVSDSNVIQSVTESLVGKVDAIYIPTDNLLAEGMANVAQVTNVNKIPVITGEAGMAKAGGLGSYAIDYYNLGYKSGVMAANVLNGEDVSKMPIEYLPEADCKLTINKTTADQIGLVIDKAILDKAEIAE